MTNPSPANPSTAPTPEAVAAEAVAELCAAAERFRLLFVTDTDPPALTVDGVDDSDLIEPFERLTDSIAAVRSVPVPAPGVTVTEEIARQAIDVLRNVQNAAPWTPDFNRAIGDCYVALSAALRPKE